MGRLAARCWYCVLREGRWRVESLSEERARSLTIVGPFSTYHLAQVNLPYLCAYHRPITAGKGT